MSTENSGKNKGNVKNLAPHQFKPGESGNPGGRPKKLPITDYIHDQLAMPVPASMRAKLPSIFAELYGENATFGEMLAFRLVVDAANGSMKALSTVLERTEGKVTQQMALSGSATEPITFQLIRVDV